MLKMRGKKKDLGKNVESEFVLGFIDTTTRVKQHS